MARETTITLTDDLTGGKAEETVTFGLDGHTYEIDLNKKNAGALRKALADFVEHGRRHTASAKPSGARRGRRAEPAGPNPADIRAWAAENGHTVSARGRVAESVRTAYLEAQNA